MTAAPKKIWPIGGYAPGSYQCFCTKCGQSHMADKRAFHCADCTLQIQAAEITRLRAQVDGLTYVYWKLRSYAVHDDDCTFNKPPHYRGCSCGLTKALQRGEELTASKEGGE